MKVVSPVFKDKKRDRTGLGLAAALALILVFIGLIAWTTFNGG